ncbi:JAB1/MPN domain-containing protein, partial [Neoconidiobolus thromboides FSU 785]
LRKINLNPKLIDQFLKIANENTINNIETCGLLSGSLIHNEFYLKSLIIPEQIGTSDSCIMINEEKWYHLIDENEWLLLGWIHTHPTQSCFLSSVDLHTHYPFQLMLSESIAIVCSPKFQPNFGTFRLTDPPGMPIISNCKEKSMFHPH